MRAVTAYSAEICRELTGFRIEVSILSDITESWAACYGSQGLVFNLGRLGHTFFEKCSHGPTDSLNELLIHEIGHSLPGGDNHLATEYHEGLCNLGAKLTRLAIEEPSRFSW
jgi:hypothetical protein